MKTAALVPVALATLLACTGCAVRMGVTQAEATPESVPRSAPPKAPSPGVAPENSAAPTRGESAPVAPAVATAPTAATPPAAATKAPASDDAVASPYVFAPKQAVAASPSTARSGNDAAPQAQAPDVASNPDSAANAPGAEDTSPPPDEPAKTAQGELQLRVVASASEIAPGAIMTVDVMASSSSAVVDAPLHLTFDPRVVEFVDSAPGEFLSQGGSSVVFFADGQSRPGDVAVAAGRVERERGASGAGLLCRIRLRGLASGTTPVLVGRAKAWGTRGEVLTVSAGGTNVVVN